MARTERTILGIDPGLANTGWGVVAQSGPRLACVAYGCISTPAQAPLARRLGKIHEQMAAVIRRFAPTCVGIETVWFGANAQSAFATGQARGAALVACAEGDLPVGEFSPSQIKLAVVGAGSADKVLVLGGGGRVAGGVQRAGGELPALIHIVQNGIHRLF